MQFILVFRLTNYHQNGLWFCNINENDLSATNFHKLHEFFISKKIAKLFSKKISGISANSWQKKIYEVNNKIHDKKSNPIFSLFN